MSTSQQITDLLDLFVSAGFNDGKRYGRQTAGNYLSLLRSGHGAKDDPFPKWEGKRTLYILQESVAWRYLKSGCRPSRVRLDDIRQAVKQRNARLEQSRANRLKAIREELSEKATAEVEQLRARNAALEANALHMEAELRRREEELVEAGKDAAVRNRECEALREANAELLNEVQELRQRDKARDEEVKRMRETNRKNADGYYAAELLAKEAEDKSTALEADNARLRRALLEQATCFSTTIQAILPA